MLGIIGAMDEEVAQIKEKMTDVTVTSVAGMDFYQGKLGGKDAVGSLWYRQGKCRYVQSDSGGSVPYQCDCEHRYRRFPARGD